MGVSPVWISGLYLAFNATYALLSVPAGMLADRFGPKKMILCGFVLFAMVYAGFALTTSVWQIAGLFISYGLYMGGTECSAPISDVDPSRTEGHRVRPLS